MGKNKKKDKGKSAEGEKEGEMKEVADPEGETKSQADSDVERQKSDDGGSVDDEDDMSFVSGSSLDDRKEMLKRKARERIHKCVVFLSEFWKIIMLLLQAGIVGGLGLLAYYMEFQDIFPKKETIFDCNDASIAHTYNISVFRAFVFGEYIAEDWVFLFSWFAPPGIVIVVELVYSFQTGCMFSHRLKLPLVVRRLFRIIGNYFFGMVCILIIVKSTKIFLATPRPYFLSVCQPNVTDCFAASHLICTNPNHTVLDDMRTSFPSLPIGALSYSCIFVGLYLHQMVRSWKLFIVQTLSFHLFLMISFLGACIEVGSKRSHWYDVVASYVLGVVLCLYQFVTLNFFVERFQPPLPTKKDFTWVQTDPLPEPESDNEYPYEEIEMGRLPKRKLRPGDTVPCVHRPNSFDSSFQSDMARSMKVFKALNGLWTSNKPPSFDPDKAYYEQPIMLHRQENDAFVDEQKKPLEPAAAVTGTPTAVENHVMEKPNPPIDVDVVKTAPAHSTDKPSESALDHLPEAPGLNHRRPSTIAEIEESDKEDLNEQVLQVQLYGDVKTNL